MKKKVYAALLVFIFLSVPAATVYALNFATLFPVTDLAPIGFGNQWISWVPSQPGDHHTLVDEPGYCDTDTYVFTRTNGAIENYGYDISAIPNGSVITAIDLYPCAGTWAGARGVTSTLSMSPIVNGEYLGAYNGTTYNGVIAFSPGTNALQELGPYSWNVSIVKNDQTTMSAWYFYTGTHPTDPQTIVLSKARMVITYVQ